MKIKDLIELLSDCHPDASVMLYYDLFLFDFAIGRGVPGSFDNPKDEGIFIIPDVDVDPSYDDSFEEAAKETLIDRRKILYALKMGPNRHN